MNRQSAASMRQGIDIDSRLPAARW